MIKSFSHTNIHSVGKNYTTYNNNYNNNNNSNINNNTNNINNLDSLLRLQKLFDLQQKHLLQLSKQQQLRKNEQQKPTSIKRSYSDIDSEAEQCKRIKQQQQQPTQPQPQSQPQYRYENFIPIKLLSQGSSANVYKAFDKTKNQFVIMKTFIKPNNKNKIVLRKILLTEVMLQHQLSKTSDKITKVLGIVENDDKIAVIYPYFEKGDLLQYLNEYFIDEKGKSQGIPESKFKEVALQISSGLKHLHDNDVVHRDVKLENVCVDENEQCKIIDLSDAKKLTAKTRGYVGTLHYIAPEVLAFKNNTTEVTITETTKSADIWSLGVMFYIMMTGKFPWGIANENEKSYRDFLNKDSKSFQALSDKQRELLEFMFEVDPEQRLDIDDVIELLEQY